MSLIYKGKDLKKLFGLEMLTELTIENAVRDIETIEVPGRDGVILIDNDRYKGVAFSPKFIMWKKDTFVSFEEQQNALTNLMTGSYGYSEMTILGNSNYTYMARVVDEVRITLDDEVSAEVEINFSLKPIKYITSGLDTVDLVNGAILNNIGKVPSNPMILLIGTGNVTLTIGSKTVVFKNITDGVVVDLEHKTVTNLDKNSPKWETLYTWPLPSLPVGSNKISWDNSSFKISMIPRWGVTV